MKPTAQAILRSKPQLRASQLGIICGVPVLCHLPPTEQDEITAPEPTKASHLAAQPRRTAARLSRAACRPSTAQPTTARCCSVFNVRSAPGRSLEHAGSLKDAPPHAKLGRNCAKLRQTSGPAATSDAGDALSSCAAAAYNKPAPSLQQLAASPVPAAPELQRPAYDGTPITPTVAHDREKCVMPIALDKLLGSVPFSAPRCDAVLLLPFASLFDRKPPASPPFRCVVNGGALPG